MSRWLAEFRSHPVRTLVPVALVALAPKCALCVLAYAGIGAALGFSGRELCGSQPGFLSLVVPLLALAGGVLGLVGFVLRRP
jgi:hypothetical protein